MITLEYPPTNAQAVDDKGYIGSIFERWLVRLVTVMNNTQATGTTAQRPTLAPYVGFMYFDTTLNKPVFASAVTTSSTTWRDAAGTVV